MVKTSNKEMLNNVQNQLFQLTIIDKIWWNWALVMMNVRYNIKNISLNFLHFQKPWDDLLR
jgi:hypothetical protein